MGRVPRRSGLDRRQALALLARGGALLVAGCGTAPASQTCVLAPTLTAGPYWRDDALHRSDLRWDSQPSSGQEPLPGVPLALAIRVSTSGEEQCRPVRGAQVDLWQCDAQGVYSGVPERGTAGRDFLRGYQVTDEAGQARFLTVYDGWYPGRTVHIHAKVRTFDPFGEVTTEISTQLFFDDAATDTVLETAAYAGRGPRDTSNATDPILRGQQAAFVSLAGDVGSGMQGEVELGVRIGEIRRE
jgi:protocatechuate 3,4-dioxygenase beta subunit